MCYDDDDDDEDDEKDKFVSVERHEKRKSKSIDDRHFSVSHKGSPISIVTQRVKRRENNILDHFIHYHI